MQKNIAICLILGLSLAVGCKKQTVDIGPSSSEPAPAGEISSDETPALEKQIVDPADTRAAVVDLGTEANVAPDNPLDAGWKSEVIADRASIQLKHLGEILAQGDGAKFDIASVVADDCLVVCRFVFGNLKIVLAKIVNAVSTSNRGCKERKHIGHNIQTMSRRVHQPFENGDIKNNDSN